LDNKFMQINAEIDNTRIERYKNKQQLENENTERPTNKYTQSSAQNICLNNLLVHIPPVDNFQQRLSLDCFKYFSRYFIR
jgi:hypothetical protein